MKFSKKLFSVLLAAIMIISTLPLAFAAGVEITSGKVTDDIIYSLTDDGVLTIKGTGPILDLEEVEYDEEGYASVSKLDCIGWRLNAFLEEQTEGLSTAEVAAARFDFIKEIVIEEGITSVPDDEFSDFYPEKITIPASMQTLGNNCLNATYATSVVFEGGSTICHGGLGIPAHLEDAEAFGSLEDAKQATIAAEEKNNEISTYAQYFYDAAAIVEFQNGMSDYENEEQLIDYFNESFGIQAETLADCESFCVETINEYFGFNFTSINEICILVSEDDFAYIEKMLNLKRKFKPCLKKLPLTAG